MIEADGPSPMYTWLTAQEIIKELTKITKTKYKVKNEKQWQKAMNKHLPNWTILDTDDVDEAYT